MPQQSETEELIETHQRRLQILKEKKATLGISTPPEVQMEIEDIEKAIKDLREKQKSPDQSEGSRVGPSRKVPRDSEKPARGSPVEILVAKIGLTGAIIAALLGLIGVVLAAYIGYLGIQTQVKMPIEATQTAEAKSASPAVPLPTPTSLPVVYLMDSKEPEMVYNPPGTNTDDIRDILRYLPIKPPMEELIYAEWDGAEIMSQLDPDLIIIHNSAFYTSTTTADPAKRFGAFLWGMEDTRTKFLIYSRADTFSDEAKIKKYFEDTYPFLKGRVDVLWIPKGDAQYCNYWDCSDTREKLRRKVKSLLLVP